MKILSLLSFFFITSIQAATIVSYDFNNSANRLGPITSGLNLSATNISAGSGSTFNYNQDLGADYSLMVTKWGTSSFSSSITRNDTFSFMISPQSGYYLTLTSLAAYARSGSSTSGQRYQIQYSLDSGSTWSSLLISGDVNTTWAYSNNLINQIVYNSVMFRFSGYLGSNNRSIYFDDIVVSGSVSSVPVPNSMILLSVLLLIEYSRRRLKSRPLQAF